jgi:hypothetical protein
MTIQTRARKFLGGHLIVYRYQTPSGFLRSRWHARWTR